MDLTGYMTLLLVAGATARLTRLIVTDDLGLWYIRGPAAMWAQRHDQQTPAPDQFQGTQPLTGVWLPGWRSKLVSGLMCVFCVGFWVGCLVLLSLALIGGPEGTNTPAVVWRYIAGVLTLNYAVGHLGSRLGDTADDEES